MGFAPDRLVVTFVEESSDTERQLVFERSGDDSWTFAKSVEGHPAGSVDVRDFEVGGEISTGACGETVRGP